MRTTFSAALDYVILREVARGGMGVVYETLQCGIEGFSKRVALKVLLPALSSLRSVFTAEAHLVADLVHENIVQTYNLGEVDDQLFITMEYIDGVSLKQLVVRHMELGSPLPVELATFVASRVARALEYAHSRRDPLTGRPLGIVHRDVCPANVLMTREGVVKLSDFGVAKVRARQLLADTDGNVLVGRARYMAPEQARLEETDARADLFSLGVILYELLTCTAQGKPRGGMLLPIRMLNPEVPAELAAILEAMTAREPGGRPASAGEVGLALEKYLYGGGYGPTNLTLKSHLEEVFPELAEAGEPGE